MTTNHTSPDCNDHSCTCGASRYAGLAKATDDGYILMYVLGSLKGLADPSRSPINPADIQSLVDAAHQRRLINRASAS